MVAKKNTPSHAGTVVGPGLAPPDICKGSEHKAELALRRVLPETAKLPSEPLFCGTFICVDPFFFCINAMLPAAHSAPGKSERIPFCI